MVGVRSCQSNDGYSSPGGGLPSAASMISIQDRGKAATKFATSLSGAAIDSECRQKIDVWLKIYSYAIEMLIECSEQSCEEAFYEYEDYLEGNSNYE